MPNQHKNKVVYNGNTLIDLTGDTVSANDVTQGVIFHLPTGQQSVGTHEEPFIVTLDAEYRQGNNWFFPVETYAEIEAAVNSGKEIAIVFDEDISAVYIDKSADGVFDSSTNEFKYQVFFKLSNGYVYEENYVYTANNLTRSRLHFNDTSDATITQDKVLNGYVGYGANGKVTGNIATKTSSDLTASGATVTVPSGYYASQATKSVASGTEGTPIATKGTVSDHSVSVTPSVTNTNGYITGSTITGTAVTVSASELVSGNITLTENTNEIIIPETTQTSWMSTDTYYYRTYNVGNIVAGVAYTVIWDGDEYNFLSTGQYIGNRKIKTASAPDTGEPFCMQNPFDNYIYVYVADNASHTFELLKTGVDVTQYATASVAVPSSQPTLQSKTYNVSGAGTATVTADSGYDGLSSVAVSVPSANLLVDATSDFATVSGVRKWWIQPNATAGIMYGYDAGWAEGVYEASQISYNAVPANTTITPTTSSQTVGGANYMMEGAVTVAAMPSGTAGTPTATKGSVSNHSVSVTPSVTNTSGYITGSTKTGTAVTVSASELVSGSETKTENGTYDVTNLAELVVNVSGGGGSSMQTDSVEGGTMSASSITFTGLKGEPLYYSVTVDNNVATGTPAKIAAITYDGTTLHGQTITNTTNAQVSYDGSSFSHSYSNGSLTITSTGASFMTGEAYFLDYAYGGSAANVNSEDVQVGSGATSITFTGLEDEPLIWSCIFKSNFSSSSGYQRVIFVNKKHNDFVVGYAMDSSAHISNGYWTATYNNGSLTITSQGTNAGGYFHQPGYYQLTYVLGEASPYQQKTVTPTTSQQIVEPDTGYDALSKVTVNAIPSEYIIPTGNYAITANGNNINVAQYATVSVNVPSSGGANFATATMTNSNNQNTSISFTLPSGRTPKAFFCRLTTQITRSSNSRYYYVENIRWDGSTTGGVEGRCFYMYSGQLTNITSGYSYSQSGTTFTLSSTGSRSASPGSFYNDTYEMVYVY